MSVNLQDLLIDIGTKYQSGEISEKEYLDSVELYQQNYEDQVSKFLGNRIDNRSLRQFAQRLIKNSKIEKDHADFFFKNYAKDYFDFEEYYPSGIDQSGILYLDNARTAYPDYMTDTGIYVEIKDCPVLNKATYKKSDLEYYLDQKSWIFTSHHKFKSSHNERVFFTVISPEDISSLLKREFKKHREVGWKLSVQIKFPDDLIERVYV